MNETGIVPKVPLQDCNNCNPCKGCSKQDTCHGIPEKCVYEVCQRCMELLEEALNETEN